MPPLLQLRPCVSPLRSSSVTLILRLVLQRRAQGTFGWQRLFVLPRGEGKNEYLPACAAFDYGPRFVLDRFAELVPALPVHCAGHPPGLLLVDALPASTQRSGSRGSASSSARSARR